MGICYPFKFAIRRNRKMVMTTIVSFKIVSIFYGFCVCFYLLLLILIFLRVFNFEFLSFYSNILCMYVYKKYILIKVGYMCLHIDIKNKTFNYTTLINPVVKLTQK